METEEISLQGQISELRREIIRLKNRVRTLETYSDMPQVHKEIAAEFDRQGEDDEA